MHIHSKLITLFCLLLLLNFQSTVEAASVFENIGGVPIVVPFPEGFDDPSKISQEVRNTAETITPKENRLLAVFIPDEDMQYVSSQEEYSGRRYIFVQSNKQIESVDLSKEQFDKLKSEFKKKQQDLIDNSIDKNQWRLKKASKEIGRQFKDETRDIKYNEIKSLGVFLDQNDAFGVSALTKRSKIVNGVKQDTTIVNSSTIIYIKKKIIYLLVNSVYDTKEDLDWSQDTSKKIVSSMIDMNKNYSGANVSDQTIFIRKYLYNMSIEIPSNWDVIDEKVMNKIDSDTQNKLGVNQENNNILIAANYHKSDKKKSDATMRLSIRFAETGNQDMLSKITNSEDLKEFDEPNKKQLLLVSKKLGVELSKVYPSEILSVNGKYCIHSRYIMDNKLNNLYIFMFGDKLIKLMTSNNEDDGELLRITNRIVDSLRIDYK